MSLFRKTSIIAAAVISAAVVTTAVEAAPAMPPWRVMHDHDHWRDGHWDRDHDWRWGGFWRAPFVFGYNLWTPYPWPANGCRALAIQSERNGLTYWQEHRVLASHGCNDAFMS